MKFVKIIGLGLVAAFLASVVAVASASATTITFLFPEGAAKLQDFSSKSGKGKLVVKSGEKGEVEVKCESVTNTGSVLKGTDLAENILIVFRKCTTKLEGKTWNCTSSEQETGTIKTFELKGELGLFTNASSESRVGLVIQPETGLSNNPNNLFAEFKCVFGAKEFTVQVRGHEGGGVIGEVLPGSVNRSLAVGEPGELSYKNNSTSPWIQEPTSLTVLGKLVDNLYLEAKYGPAAEPFQQAAIVEEEDVKIYFLELAEISAH